MSRPRLRRPRSMLIAGALATIGAAFPARSQTIDQSVPPFVGCAADGQMGPVEAPASADAAPVVPSPASARLAYYTSEHLGVLAPRGWRCFGLYGSSGETLIVAPERLDAARLPYRRTGLTGPAIHLSRRHGDTSGRFKVAQTAARLFPSAEGFVRSVIAEGLWPASDFPFGPFPRDRLNRLSATEVEFRTPANTEGMGTSSRLAKSGRPIVGLAILLPNEDMDLVYLAVRLPPEAASMGAIIIEDVRRRRGRQPQP